MNSKLQQALIYLVMGALTVGTISVTGLLQSTETLGASGIIIRPMENPNETIQGLEFSLTPPPPEPEVEINIFSDPSCTELMSDVEWGEIEVGGESTVKIYVKNEGDTEVVISLVSENWSSDTAQSHMDLSWDYSGNPIQKDEIKEINLSLSVDEECPELSNFNFDIIIIGT